MEANELVTNLLKGNRSMVRKALDGLSDEEVATRPNTECNSMAWLLWHLARAEDGIVSGLDGSGELWKPTDGRRSVEYLRKPRVWASGIRRRTWSRLVSGRWMR